MKCASERYLHLVHRRLELLHTLVRTGEQWRRAYIAFDLQDSQRFVAEEELLCEQIRILDSQIVALQGSQAMQSIPAAKERESNPAEFGKANPSTDHAICAALEQMAEVHRELKRSNEARRAILKRSKRTIDALHNLFNSYAPTYSSPAALSVGTIYEESV